MKRALVVLGTLALLGACAESPTAPISRRIAAPATKTADDLPPDTPCRSGWLYMDGRWVCNDG